MHHSGLNYPLTDYMIQLLTVAPLILHWEYQIPPRITTSGFALMHVLMILSTALVCKGASICLVFNVAR